LVKSGSNYGKPQAWYKACGRSIALTYATACYDSNAEPAILELLVMLHFWQRLHLTECQRDELWSFVHTKGEEMTPD
jgi:hypothetical protein